MSKVIQLVFGIAGVLVFAVLVLPAAAGYGYALAMLPAYDQSASCKDQKADPIREDDYRVYLLNRGCNIQKAMEDLGGEVHIESERLMAFYRGELKPSSADETIGWDAVQGSLKTFKSFSATDDCPPDCGMSGAGGGSDPISRMFDGAFQKYLEIALPIFLGAIGMGASHVAGIMQQGPLAQGLLYMAYVVGLAIAASALYDLLKQAIK
jgi:hypothetical protein